MADNIIQVNVTSNKPKKVSVSSSNVQNEITASADTSKYFSGLARNWATSETLVENTDYSAKYYANKSKVNAENSKAYAESTQTLYNDFIDNFSNYQGLLEETAQSGVATINETSTQATESINNTVENAIETIDTTVSEEVKNLTNIADEKVNVLNTTADEQISNIKATGFYMEDDKLYFINSKNEVEEFKSGGSSYAPPLLSHQWTDHILNDIRWLRADTFSWQDGGVYFGAYDTLEAEYNNENSVVESNYISSNVNIVGSLNDNQGVLSGFSASAYAEIPNGKQNNNAEYVIKFTTGSDVTTAQAIFHSEYFINVEVKNGYCVCYNWGSNVDKNLFILTTNTTYWVRLLVNGNSRTYYYSTDGTAYTEVFSVADTGMNISANYPVRFGLNSASTKHPFLGTIDLNECYINNNGSRVWNGINGIVYKRTPNGYKIADVSQEEAILNKYNTDGIAWFYIIDTTNKRFKLPRTKYGFTGVRTNVGDDIEQIVKLPNITGSACNGYDGDAFGQSGAFYNGTPIANGGFGFDGNSHSTYSASLFDASRSSDVYSGNGTDTKIQEPATQMYLYFYVGSYTTDAIENTAGLNTELFNSKLDIDCNNISATGKDFMSGMGMPSDRYVDLTAGASATEYTAPANGWVKVLATHANNSNWGAFEVCALNSVGNVLVAFKTTTSLSNQSEIFTIPVYAGQRFRITFNDFSVSQIRFIYAIGSKGEV